MINTSSSVWCVLGPVIFSLLSPVIVQAQEECQPEAPVDATPEERAVALFAQSEGEYEAGRAECALSLLEEAYELHPEPILLYNQGLALEALGRDAEAADAYEGYLSGAGEVPGRNSLLRKIEALRRAAEPSVITVPAEAPPEPDPVVWPAWLTTIVGAVALGAGTGMFFGARSLRDTAEGEASGADANSTFEDAELLNGLSIGALIGGAVLTLVGTTWLLVLEFD